MILKRAWSLAYLVAMSQTPSAELEGTGVKVQVRVSRRGGHRVPRAPGSRPEQCAAHERRRCRRRQPAWPRTGRDGLRPGVEDTGLLDAVFRADLAAFGAQSPEPATRYRAD